MKILKKIGWLLLVVLIALQFFRPEKMYQRKFLKQILLWL